MKTTHRPFRSLATRRKAHAPARSNEGSGSVRADLRFREVAASAGVRPLAPGGRRVPKASEPRSWTPDEPTSFTLGDDSDFIQGYRSDLGPSALRSLRGTPHATLDLHGMRLPAARGRLTAFLSSERARGRRVVLVIVGKGRHSPDGRAVLRSEISAWLAASPHVLAFRTAPQNLGGSGSVLVALRPSR